MSSMLDKAWALAERGFYVFPLSSNSKKPMPGSRGFRDATNSQNIKDLWAKTPDANIGIATGLSRLLVVDVDTKKVDGEDTLTRLELEHGVLPFTFEVYTPSGGRHVYFKIDKPVQSSAGRLGPGVDIRSEGGYVVAPGSVIDGKTYSAHGIERIAEAPEWLVRLAGTPEERAANADEWLVEPDIENNIEAARKFLKATEPAIEGRGGHNHTYQTAAIVRDFGVSENLCLDLMMQHWNYDCQPPWDHYELQDVVHNAYAYAKRPAGTRARTAVLERLPDIAPQTSETRGNTDNPFRPYNIDELKNLPKPEWLIEDVLQQGSMAMAYGPPESYKTFLVLSMGLSVASGADWAAHTVRQGPVVYVTNEGTRSIGNRVRAWIMGAQAKPGDNFQFVPLMPLMNTTSPDPGQLVQALDGVRPKLVIIDTLARAMVGMDENNQKDAGEFVATAEKLQRSLGGPTVLVVHHSGKDKSKGARGSTVFMGAMDTVFEVRAFHQDGRRQVNVYNEKQKDAEALPPMSFTIEKVSLGNEEQSVWLKPGEYRRPTQQVMAENRVKTLEDILYASELKELPTAAVASALANALEIDDDTAAKWLNRNADKTLRRYVACDSPRTWTHPDNIKGIDQC